MAEFLHGLAQNLDALAKVMVALGGLIAAALGLLRLLPRRGRPRGAAARDTPPPDGREDPPPRPGPGRSDAVAARVPGWKLALRAAICFALAMVFSGLSDLAWDPFLQPVPGGGFLLLVVLTMACLAAMLWFAGRLALRGLRFVFRN
ncbi:hypothetical protein [Mangrovicoccus algicola]|uniref:Uncharacterized protein n=1 Tax=Mangrovicoccus algicola TaxID=2771008 RepID=A0A8J7CUM9_9RHOB|nr:hypothetical protein [Mangrovicoccus algicola]MBE3637709.1 hypothetical protein [Mangrovicoccus algicola]